MAKKVSASSRMERVEHSFDPDKDLLHTGSTMLNLMLSGRPDGGYVRGRYFYFVGDSSSGKTWFTLAALAEAANNPAFDDYRLIYDDVEGGALMDKERYFGNKLAQRIEAPSGTRDNPEHSDTVESFYFNLDDAFKRREPFINDVIERMATLQEAGFEFTVHLRSRFAGLTWQSVRRQEVCRDEEGCACGHQSEG